MWSRDFDIRPLPDGFKVLHKGRAFALASWGCITGIAGFNHVTMAVDIVYLVFFRPDQGDIELNEDMSGWDVLNETLFRRFGIPRDWQSRVWLPPGELNWLTLWGHAPPPGNRCWKCGYDLEGNVSGVCPECGVRFSL